MARIVIINTERQTLGDDKVRISLSLPSVAGNADKLLCKGFLKYYGSMRTGFLRFAKETLLKKASNADKPYGAVLKAVVSYENSLVVSVYVDAAISTEEERRITRISQLWDKKSGTLKRTELLFNKGYKKKLLTLFEEAAIPRAESAGISLYSDWREILRKRFDKNNFYVTPKGLVFFYPSGSLSDKNDIFPVPVSADKLTSVLNETSYGLFWTEE